MLSQMGGHDDVRIGISMSLHNGADLMSLGDSKVIVYSTVVRSVDETG